MPALLSGFRKSFLSRIINKKTFIKKVIRKMVPEAGLEPARYRYRWILSRTGTVSLPVDFESTASTSFTTRAFAQLL